MTSARGALITLAVAAVATGCGAQARPAARLVYAMTPDRMDLAGLHGWIWSAHTDGSHPVRLVRGTDPALSPNGMWIAFARKTRASATVDLVRADGGARRVLHTIQRARALIGQPVWAPDSRLIVVSEWDGRSEALALVDAATGARTVIARSGRLEGPGRASFSPDSRLVAYETDSPTGGNIFVYDIADRLTTQITHDRRAMDPLWGPRWIAYSEASAGGTGDVWLMRGNGRDKHRLTHTHSGIEPDAWSTDGTRMLADNPATHNGRLWAVDVRTGGARPITPWIGNLFAQGLSKDGTTILAAIGCGGMPESSGVLETLRFAGGSPHVIARGPCRGSWNG